MKNHDSHTKKEIKKIKKRSLKKRIFRVISYSNISIILILCVAIFLGGIAILKGSALTMSYFISSKIVKEISSDSFLEHMNIDSIEELRVDSKEFKYWINDIDKTLRINFFTQVDEHIDLSPKALRDRKKLLKELREVEEINDELYKELVDEENDSYTYYARVSIKIKDKTLYETGKWKSGHTKKYEDDLPEWEWLRTQIDNMGIKIPIYNQNYEEIGVVEASLNHLMLGDIIIVLLIGIIFICIILLVLSKLITKLFTTPILDPLKELQDKMDEVAGEEIGENFGKPITFKKPFYEIEKLANSTNMIMCKMKEYTELLQQQKDEMEAQRDELESQKEELESLTLKLGATNADLEQKNGQLENIFNNVSQGFLTFGSDLRVKQEYSLECRSIFKSDIAGKYFPELLFQDDTEQIQFLDDILNKILQEENSEMVELYIPLLPTEIMINNRYIHISYKLVKDIMTVSGKTFMLILTDITDKKALERQRNEERRLLSMVVKVISNQEVFVELVDEFKDFIKSIKYCTLINEDCFEECYSEIYRQIHTFKGSFSQFDIYDIIDELHDLESRLSKEKEELSRKGVNSIKDLILQRDFENILSTNLKIFEEYLGKDFFNQKDIIRIKKQKIVEIENKIVKMLPGYEQKQLLSDVRRLRYKPLKELLRSYTESTLKLSQRMGKEIKPFEIGGDEVLVDPKYYSDFIKSLVHVFRNCVDHGIEEPEERYLTEKSEIGLIGCKIEDQKDYVKITISDDGRGINFDKVRRKLWENNVYSQDEIEDLDENKLLEAIFMDEFSTETEITEISGRGVGLAAVKNELEKIEGKFEVVTEKGIGTSFIFTLPITRKENFKYLSIETILNSLAETSIRYIKDQTSINLEPLYEEYKRVDKINLNKITVLINIKGDFNAIFALSINEELAKKLVKSFVIDELTPEEEAECLDDVVAESSNIIIGNSVKSFDEMDQIVNIGSPTILCYKGASIKNIDSNMMAIELANNGYKLNLSIISMNNKEDDLWHVS
ncbi:ATP-binding protein [Wukongibacter baidiensis]|uniref:ATP-binding protein n=1 Tax=Wukongibacter baidiensis TaxID=1723361 RepID=UPI003D7FD94B